MLKNEWKRLIQNKFLIIVLIAIITIPTIYTTLFLGSMWDPYGKVKNLPVAVVNHDVATVYEDKVIDVGDRLVESLKENDALSFHFVEEETARAGLADGTFYMIITIPKEFSANAITVLDEVPEKMVLQYETNPATNYIASKMSDTAIAKIQKTITEKVTKEYADVVFDQIAEIGDGLEEAAEGTNELLDGAGKLQEGNQTITDNLTVLAESTVTFVDGSKELQGGLSTYTNGVSTLADGITTLSDGITTFATTAQSGTSSLQEGATSLQQGVTTYTDGVASANKGAQQLVQNNAALNQGISTVTEGVTSLKQGSAGLLTGLHQLSDTMSNSMSEEKKAQMQSLQQGIESLNANIQALNTSLQSLDMSAEDAEAMLEAMKELVNALATGANTVLPTADKTIGSLVSGMTTVEGAINQQLIPGMTSLDAGLGSVQNGLTGTTGLKTGIHTYTAGVSILGEGLATLNNNSSALTSGTNQLSAGIGQLASGLSGGLEQLQEGTAQLVTGSNLLVSNKEALLSGASQLTEGAGKIQDGASQLAEGSQTLGEGLDALQEGTTTLSSGLEDAALQVKDTTSTVGDHTLDMFAAPVDTLGTHMVEVENNGHAMASYMMVVALWVACMGLMKMYPLTEHEGKMKSGVALWFSKASVMYPVAIAWSVIMTLALQRINGFKPVNMGKTVLVAAIASITFVSIMYFFNVVFGKVGTYLLFILMVVQLSGCTGTYPTQLSGDFVAKIHDYLPFSYVVAAFRGTISGGMEIGRELGILLGITGVFVAMTIVFFEVKKRVGNHEEDMECIGMIGEVE